MRLTDFLALRLFVLLVILLSPIILPIVTFSVVKNKLDEVRFKRYLATNEGSLFFAYTDKPSSKKYIEDEILPQLPAETRVFHLAGKKGRYNMGEDFGLLAHIVGAMRETKGGFPYISKVIQGAVSDRVDQ